MSMQSALTDWIARVLIEFCAHDPARRKVSTLGAHALNDGKYFVKIIDEARLARGRSLSLVQVDKAIAWFEENWPEGATWPSPPDWPYRGATKCSTAKQTGPTKGSRG